MADKQVSFLRNLKIFAVDELHYYTGLLGTYVNLLLSPSFHHYVSHVAMIMRRFRRLCAAIGSKCLSVI